MSHKILFTAFSVLIFLLTIVFFSIIFLKNKLTINKIIDLTSYTFNGCPICIGPQLEVDEVHIARAIIAVLERERLVADGAGVCSLAAVMQGLVPELRGKR